MLHDSLLFRLWLDNLRANCCQSRLTARARAGYSVKFEFMEKKFYLKNLRTSNVLMGNANTLYICASYIPPESSPYFNNDIFHDIREDINKFGSLNNPIMLCGDFNARTGNLVDFIPYLGDKHDAQNMNVPTQVNTQRRNSDH